jgi:nuclear pore complex protein Nup160
MNDSRGPLLGPEPQQLIRVLHTSENDISVDDNLRVLVFMPTPSALESGGWFHLFRVSPSRAVNKELSHIRSVACSHRTGGAELRDFMVHRSSLYALWDQKGQPLVESISFDPEIADENEDGEVWYSTTYPPEAELTPDYLDELLLRSGGGSLVDTFMAAILRPGVFSHFTIETALQQYTDSLLSIPGVQSGPLRQSYLTLIEHIAAVVGCTVNVTVDPRTGIPQRANYWNALKRDWEGFVARCREIERSGRWPLSLGISHSGTVLLLERERAGCLATSDKPLELQDALNHDGIAENYPILQVGSAVRQKLSGAEIHARESQFDIMVSQERGYSYAETLEHCVSSLEEPREDLTESVREHLADISDLDVHFEQVLELISSTQGDIKVEEADEDAASALDTIPYHRSLATRWSRGVTIAYVHTSIEARYKLCLSLVLLLFHIGDRRKELSPVLLARIFATFRNLIILSYLAWQPAGDPDGTQPASSADPELAILHGFQNMSVSSQRPVTKEARQMFLPTYSLNYRLMEVTDPPEAPLPQSALAHLSMTNLLSSQDAAEVTQHEVSLCKWLLDLGFRDVALEIVGRLPRSPGISYVHGLILVQIGRTDDGASLLRRVGANFGEMSRGIRPPPSTDVEQVLKHSSPRKILKHCCMFCPNTRNLTTSTVTTAGSPQCSKGLATCLNQYSFINWQLNSLAPQWILAICGEKSSLVIQSWRCLRKRT